MSANAYKIRIKKNDMVMVRSGKYKGRTGKVLATHPTTNQVTVEGINIVKKHRKPSKVHPQGGIFEITKPIAVSKVGFYDAVNKKPSRIGYKVIKTGKVRVLKTNGKELSNG